MIAILTVLAATKRLPPLCEKTCPPGAMTETPSVAPPLSAWAMMPARAPFTSR